MNITNGTCYGRYSLLTSDDVDVVFIKFAFGIALVAIIAINGYLIKLLWEKRRISVNLLFIILSCFDITNSITIIPFFWILNMLKESSCRLKLVMDFTSIVGLEYPWFMITIIAIDRYLIIKKERRVHAKYMSKKAIFCYIFISIIVTTTLALWYTFTTPKGEWKLTIPISICLLVILAEFSVIFSLYVHLVVFVYKKYKRMEGNRQRTIQGNFSKRTAKTVFILLSCLVSCNLAHAVVLLYINLDQPLNQKVVRNLFCWSSLISQLNSFFNALIIINRTVKKQTTSTEVLSNKKQITSPEVQSSKKQTISPQVQCNKEQTISPQVQSNKEQTTSPQVQSNKAQTTSPQVQSNKEQTTSPQVQSNHLTTSL